MTKHKKLAGLLSALFFTSAALAQTTTSSPYSRFGIGEIQKSVFTQSRGMGGISNGLRSNSFFNFSNPASYSALTLTTFEVSAYAKTLRLSNSTATQTNYNGSISYLAFGFPLSPRAGASLGLVPFSGVGYKVSVPTQITGLGDVTQIFEGNGGLNQFYIGGGYNVHKNISIGVNASYVFGSINEIRANEFNDTLAYFNTRQTNSTYIGDFYFNYGIQYFKDIRENLSLTIGYSGALKSNLSAERNTLAERYQYTAAGYETLIDTVQMTANDKGKIVLPAFHSLGFAFEKKNKWIVGADVSTGAWSTFRNYGQDPGLNNSFEVSIGGQITPDYNAVGNYFKTMDYRLGVNYGQSNVKINNENINQVGITAGLGLPFQRSGSKINLAVEVGQRGKTGGNLIREEYLNFHFGITFNDKWFVKRRYD
jgi:hypothetical protein